MDIDKNILIQYKDALEPITQIDNAGKRIENVTLFFDNNVSEQELNELNALKEYAVFIECVKRPFFTILLAVIKKVGMLEKLLNNINNYNFDFYLPLRSEEVYHLLWSLGAKKVSNLIDGMEIHSHDRDKIITALRNNNTELFKEAFQNNDTDEFTKHLWRLRYIVFGETAHLEGMDLKNKLYSRNWLNGCDFSRFFQPLSPEQEKSIIKKSVAALGEIPVGITNYKQITSDSQYIDRITKYNENGHKPYFDKWNNFIRNNGITLPKNTFVYFGDFARYSRYRCKSYAYNILCTSLTKDGVERKFEQELSVKENVGTEEIISTPITMETLAQYRNELNNDELSTKQNIDSEIMFDNRIRPYHQVKYKKVHNVNVAYYDESKSGAEAFGKDITLQSFAIVDVFNAIRNVLEKETCDVLEWIIDSCFYTRKMKEYYNNNFISKNSIQTNKPKHTIDNNEEHRNNKWFVRVNGSKIPESGEFVDDTLYDCLQNLYYKLVDRGDIDNSINKDLFIYRFSGLGTPYSVDNKINWKGKNILLGHIARCLTSDKNDPPMDMTVIGSYFRSKSGNDMNLATAKYQAIEHSLEEDMDKNNKNRKTFEPLFIDAVRLLRDCDFVNVEYTSKRR